MAIALSQLTEPQPSEQIPFIRSTSSSSTTLPQSGQTTQHNYHQSLSWFVKRAIDCIGAIVGMLLISPLLLTVMVLIKLDSKGPIFYKQERVGYQGKKFYMYKFRSMRPNADAEVEKLRAQNEDNAVMFKMKDDPRITNIGKFIRRYSIDELPQLINVVTGDMSLVGPRPPIPRELSEYEPWHFVRFLTVPGMTGHWQVSGRSNIQDFDDVVRLDYEYINQWNLLFDIRILFKTIPVVLFAKGAS